ncbi:TOM1-like protein 2 [Holothuria leucospilota]|uniref:TOM1-like protein 2 n=1 Tax=Holothuria leucospilota TaxID=206669 RepID=A0A9Q1C2G5_HOLLE|nr:TOM1-like protein 2 [Holothuria leucospilota]
MSFITKSQVFATQVGQRIERATNESQASEDWALNMEICDIINETDEGPKDAMKAIKKKLIGNRKWKEVMYTLTKGLPMKAKHLKTGPLTWKYVTSSMKQMKGRPKDAMKAIKKKLIGNRKWKEVMYTLTVLETCVKNCDHRMHVLACKQDFVRELVKIIQPNVNPPTVVQEKILAMIQTWADAFRRQPDLHGVVKVYEELKQKGIEFPATDLDTFSPIITPIRSPPQAPAPTSPQPPVAPSPGGAQQNIAKLKQDLDMVNTNVKVMSEMLTELVPGQESPDDYQLLTELNQTCRSMQQRVMELLGQVTHEEIMGELLRINDDLNNLFVRYDRHERYRQTQAGSQPVSPQQPPITATQQPVVASQPPMAGPPPPQQTAVAPLIDFGDTSPPSQAPPPLTQQLAGLDINATTNAGSQLNQIPNASGDQSQGNDDFDMFAQSRQTSYQTRGGSTYQDNTNVDQSGALADLVQTRRAPEQPQDPSFLSEAASQGLDDVEAWLQASDLSKPADTLAAANTNQSAEEGISSTEFDKFLQERAMAAENLPTLNDSNNARTPAPGNRSGRQLQMEETENTMFAL